MKTFLRQKARRTSGVSPTVERRSPAHADEIWDLDWVVTQMPARTEFLLIVNSRTRTILAAVGPWGGISDEMISSEFDRIANVEGYPTEVRMDAGFDFDCHEIFAWCARNSVYWTVTNRPRNTEHVANEFHRADGRKYIGQDNSLRLP